MCLVLDKNSVRDKRNFRRRKTPIKAYKILRIKGNKRCSPYRESEFLNEMISDREGEDPTKLTCNESFFGKVYKGLHFFLNLEQAKKEAGRLMAPQPFNNNKISHMCVYEVEIQPKDVIAVARWGIVEKERCVVAHKSRIIKLIPKVKDK